MNLKKTWKEMCKWGNEGKVIKNHPKARGSFFWTERLQPFHQYAHISHKCTVRINIFKISAHVRERTELILIESEPFAVSLIERPKKTSTITNRGLGAK
jgi:hypothetical protein